MLIVFTGNRQSELVSIIFRSLLSGRSDVSVNYVADDGDLSNDLIETLQAADVVALQERDAPRNFDLDEFDAKAERHYFPHVSVDFIWPFGGQPHVLNRIGHHLALGPFPAALGDAYLNRRIQTHVSQEVLDEYLSLRIDSLIDLDAYRAFVLEKQRRIDRAAGSDWASSIEALTPSRPICRNPFVPAPWVLQQLVARLASELRLGLSVTTGQISQLCAEEPEMPVHPSVARHFALSWAPPGKLYRLRAGDRVSFPEYARRYLAFVEGPELELGVRAVARHDYDFALDKLRLAVERPLGRGSVAAQTGLAVALAEKASGALAALDAAKAIEPENADLLLAGARIMASFGRTKDFERELRRYFEVGGDELAGYQALADHYEASGAHAQAALALRAVLARQGADASVFSRLTRALAASGDLTMASQSAQAEILLDPGNPHPRAYLAGLLNRLGNKQAAKDQVEQALTIAADRNGLDRLRQELRDLYRTLDPPFRDDLLGA